MIRPTHFGPSLIMSATSYRNMLVVSCMDGVLCLNGSMIPMVLEGES